jgi:excisionase family DNA binding protein
MSDEKIGDSEMMNVHELARFLGVTESFIYKNVQRLKIPHVKLGKMLRFLSSDIKSWLQNRKPQARI